MSLLSRMILNVRTCNVPVEWDTIPVFESWFVQDEVFHNTTAVANRRCSATAPHNPHRLPQRTVAELCNDRGDGPGDNVCPACFADSGVDQRDLTVRYLVRYLSNELTDYTGRDIEQNARRFDSLTGLSVHASGPLQRWARTELANFERDYPHLQEVRRPERERFERALTALELRRASSAADTSPRAVARAYELERIAYGARHAAPFRSKLPTPQPLDATGVLEAQRDVAQAHAQTWQPERYRLWAVRGRDLAGYERELLDLMHDVTELECAELSTPWETVALYWTPLSDAFMHATGDVAVDLGSASQELYIQWLDLVRETGARGLESAIAAATALRAARA